MTGVHDDFCGKCGSKQPDDAGYCWNCGAQLNSAAQPAHETAAAATVQSRGPAVPQDEPGYQESPGHQESSGYREDPQYGGNPGYRASPGYAAQYRGTSQAGNARMGHKNRPVQIAIIGIVALAVVGAGAYGILSLTRSGTATSQTLSASRLSLPGISLEPPQGWTSFPASESGTAVMAPAGASNACPNIPGGGPARCIEAVTISRSEPAGLNASSPQEAVQQMVNGRFSALHVYPPYHGTQPEGDHVRWMPGVPFGMARQLDGAA